jgi:hypothetical protein
MQQRVQVLSSEKKEGVSKKGNAYSMVVVSALVYNSDGTLAANGEMVLPKGHAEVKPGHYTATFKLGKGMDGRVAAYLDSLTPSAAVKAA